MLQHMFFGEPSEKIEQWLINHYNPQLPTPPTLPNDKLRLIVETTNDYKKSGILFAERDDESKPITIDWGDGTVEEVDGDIGSIDGDILSYKVHEYASIGRYEVVVENIKSYVASHSDYTFLNLASGSWYNTTSQNRYTLKEVVAMPDSITSIKDSAFYYCENLTNIVIGNNVTNIESRAFYGCSSLITNIVIPNGTSSIGDSTFGNCYRLTHVTIPSSVKSIDDHAFHGCFKLTTVNISNNSNMTSIKAYAFNSCNKLTNITIPNTVTNIGDSAFHYCRSFTDITIPYSVINIGRWAFKECNELTLTFENRTQADIDAMDNKYWGLNANQCVPGIK